MKNPRMLQGVKLAPSIFKDFIEENILDWQLPSESGKMSLMPTWEPGTYQSVFYATKEARDRAIEIQDAGFLWLPRTFYENRILMSGMTPVIKLLDKNKDKNILGAIQYIVHPKYIEVIYMATRKGWKRLGIMSILIESIIQNHGKSSIEYWQPTGPGSKFIKKRRKL